MKTDYKLLNAQIRSFAETEPWFGAFLSNVSALLFESMEDINWAGFYLLRNGKLVLGPFQGRPACIHIEIGRGVCGTAVQKRRIIRVEDVHAFPGHIACDEASLSEIVLPLFSDGKLVGVLDIDSPVTNRFKAIDEAGLAMIAETIGSLVQFS